MSVRLRIITASITAILVLCAVGMAIGFLVFWFVALPFVGARLNENAGHIAARYFVISGLAVVVLTAIGALWVFSVSSRRVAGPLSRLKRAVSEIRDGNLDFELGMSGYDEFSELGAGFEQMRVRLKDSMRMKEKAENERRAMMASVTHDLQTPITSILGYAEGILDGVANTTEKKLEYAAVIAKKARSLQLLAEDLSLLSRLENAQLPLDKRIEDIGAVVDELASEFLINHPEMRMTLSLETHLYSFIDKEKAARVLINILQNAVKYKKTSQPGPIVSITLVSQDAQALLTISDEGIGVTQGDLPHLFDRFYRADASRGLQSGSGLGLSIARHIVHLHDGKIWILNNQDGGISVNIGLPLHENKLSESTLRDKEL